jgi:hypothetical protein
MMVSDMEWEDYYFDSMHEGFKSLTIAERAYDLGEWITATGKAINIIDMTKDHLKNTIRLIKAKGLDSSSLGYRYTKLMEQEIKTRDNKPLKDILYYHPESESYFWDNYEAGSDQQLIDVTDIPKHMKKALECGVLKPKP